LTKESCTDSYLLPENCRQGIGILSVHFCPVKILSVPTGSVSGGLMFFHAPQRGLTLVAAGMLSLLALAIRNSWAIVVDIVSHPRGQQQ